MGFSEPGFQGDWVLHNKSNRRFAQMQVLTRVFDDRNKIQVSNRIV